MVNKSRYKRIFITGASGTGKTSIAQWIAKHYDVPYKSTSAKKVWGRFGFKDHSDSIVKSIIDPNLGEAYQNAILDDRLKMIQGSKEGFVTDRSPYDNYAHILLQGGFLYPETKLRELSKKCSEGFQDGDLVIFLRVTDDMHIECDGNRIITKDYQWLIDSTINSAINKMVKIPKGVKIINIATWDYRLRRRTLSRILTPEKPTLWERLKKELLR